MIGKIKKGSGFKGCVNYVLGKEQAVLLHADGVLTESRGDIIRSFCMQTGMNPDLKKPVGHIALSYSAVDAPKLTDGKMVQLAQEYGILESSAAARFNASFRLFLSTALETPLEEPALDGLTNTG